MCLLDVGVGAAFLSLHAAENYDAQVVGLTLSAEQKVYIDGVLAERGLAGPGGDPGRGLPGRRDRRTLRRGRVDRDG